MLIPKHTVLENKEKEGTFSGDRLCLVEFFFILSMHKLEMITPADKWKTILEISSTLCEVYSHFIDVGGGHTKWALYSVDFLNYTKSQPPSENNFILPIHIFYQRQNLSILKTDHVVSDFLFFLSNFGSYMLHQYPPPPTSKKKAPLPKK